MRDNALDAIDFVRTLAICARTCYNPDWLGSSHPLQRAGQSSLRSKRLPAAEGAMTLMARPPRHLLPWGLAFLLPYGLTHGSLAVFDGMIWLWVGFNVFV